MRRKRATDALDLNGAPLYADGNAAVADPMLSPWGRVPPPPPLAPHPAHPSPQDPELETQHRKQHQHQQQQQQQQQHQQNEGQGNVGPVENTANNAQAGSAVGAPSQGEEGQTSEEERRIQRLIQDTGKKVAKIDAILEEADGRIPKALAPGQSPLRRTGPLPANLRDAAGSIAESLDVALFGLSRKLSGPPRHLVAMR